MRSGIVITSIIVAFISSIGTLWLFQRATTRPIDRQVKLSGISLRLNGPFGPMYAGEMVAVRSGLFDRAGIRFELKPGDTETDPIALVASGARTLGVTRSDNFLLARSKGVPIVAFAAGDLESSVAFYVLAKSGIHTPLDFFGKRVVRFGGHDTALIYDALLKRLGISRSQIHEISETADVSALINGDVDVWLGHVGKEGYELRRSGISYNIIRPSDFGIHVPGTVYFTTEKMIRNDSSVVQKFVNTVIAGWKLTYADYSKSALMISSFDEKTLSPDRVLFELKARRDTVLPLGRRFGEYDDAQWKQLLGILINQRLIRDPDSVDLSKAVNYDFLREAYRKPITFGN
jgi:ABC-type nitrate/sulfonate/bicarbonate transport system substrate-binding protein